MLDGLKGSDRLAKLFADLGIVNSDVARGFADADGVGGEEQQAAVMDRVSGGVDYLPGNRQRPARTV